MEENPMRLAGCLFWTERNGNRYVLLSFPEGNNPFFPPGYYSVPSVAAEPGENLLDAAMRAGFECTGVLDNKAKAALFWSTAGDGIDYSVYSVRVSPSVKAGRNSAWIPLDGSLDDVSALGRFHLNAFRGSIAEKKAVS